MTTPKSGPKTRPESRARPGLAPRAQPTQQRHSRTPTPRSERTREHVIGVAALCIAERGYAEASTNRIAAEAGVSWGVLQYHFGDKAGLLGAVLERGFEALRDAFAEVEPEGETMRERVATVVDAAWAIFASPISRASMEILVNNRRERASDAAHAARLRQMTAELYALGAESLARAVGPRPELAEVQAVVLSALRGLTLNLMMQPEALAFDRERAALVDLVCRAIGSAPATERAHPSRSRPRVP